MRHHHMTKAMLFMVVFFAGCSADSAQSLPLTATPILTREMPNFTDDLGLEGLSVAVQRQLEVLRRESNREALRIGTESFHTRQLRKSLEHFNGLLSETSSCLKSEKILSRCYETLAEKIRQEYRVYLVDSALLTGYYTPTIEMSVQRTEKFRYPVYRTPPKDRERRLTRAEIDFGHKLDGKGYEIYYAADRFDLYVLHIEGGAKVLVHDNGRRYTRYLHYHADNGREFTNLYEYMVQRDMLSSAQRSRWDQRVYLNRHPDRVREIFESCPGYVFFKVSDEPAIASTGAILTPNRSLASDPGYYAVKGAIAYVVAPLPELPEDASPPESNPKGIKYRTMGRFFIDQDIGNFITGPARADLFFGEGLYAEFLSNNFMTRRGRIYLLVLK